MSSPLAEHRNRTNGNLIADYYDWFPQVGRRYFADRPCEEATRFCPSFDLPEMTPEIDRYLSGAQVAWHDLCTYQGHSIRILDLRMNPGTQTTKTFPSLIIVARAVAYIQRTGRPIFIVSATSANKGTALRDAVWRAIDCGLVPAEKLGVMIVVPEQSAHKLRHSALSADSALSARNPICILSGPSPEAVKQLVAQFAREYGQLWTEETGGRLWSSLELANYMVADSARAFFEHSVDPLVAAERRWHVHAVSSAFGLLGYHRGVDFMAKAGMTSSRHHPASLLVQHLGTPDMVLHQKFGSFDAVNTPRYDRDASTGLWSQDTDPSFPLQTFAPREILDTTFYTRKPVTAPAMTELIREYGGAGIVVSLFECLQRYPQIRMLLSEALGLSLPDDPRDLIEWSLVMALTGALNSVDRHLVDGEGSIIVHASGSYNRSDYTPFERSELRQVSVAEDLWCCTEQARQP